jgi:DNA-binding transcriptional MerR regulator
MAHFTIRELTREFGVTARTIRHYEEIGLLSPERRGQSRIYTPADRTRLKLILRGRRLGLSLDESRAIIDLYDPAHGNRAQLERLVERLREQRAALLERRRELDDMLQELDRAEAGCLDALAGKHAIHRAAAGGRRRNAR